MSESEKVPPVVLITCWDWTQSAGAEWELLSFLGVEQGAKILPLPGGGCCAPEQIQTATAAFREHTGKVSTVLVLTAHEMCEHTPAGHEGLLRTLAKIKQRLPNVIPVAFWFYQQGRKWAFRLASPLEDLLVAAAAIACGKGDCLMVLPGSRLIQFVDPRGNVFDELRRLTEKGLLVHKGGRYHYPDCSVLASRCPISGRPNSRS